MKAIKFGALLALLCLLGLSACTSMMKPSSPDFYPNAKYTSTDIQQVRADQNACMSLADEYVKEQSKWEQIAYSTGKGALIGTAAGAVGGAIMGNAGAATGAGAAAGAIIGLLSDMDKVNQHSPSYERFVEHCLQKKGYEIIGWSGK